MPALLCGLLSLCLWTWRREGIHLKWTRWAALDDRELLLLLAVSLNFLAGR